MKISARNQISGTIVSITPGAVNGTVKVDIGGGNIVTAMLVTEALAKGCISTAMIYTMHQSTLPLMCSLANEEQVERFLKPIARGELFGAFAMSEPGSGNRIWHMDSHAVADVDDFVIDSFKSFCTSAGHADFYLVPTRGHADAGATDLSLFWIGGHVPGIEPKGEWDLYTVLRRIPGAEAFRPPAKACALISQPNESSSPGASTQ